MKPRYYVFLFLLTTMIFQSCSTSAQVRRTSSDIDDLDITARGAIGRLETAISGPMFTGDGGRNIRLAILAPEVQGEVPGYLPLYIQGLLNNNFNRFSDINLIDRQNLDRIIAEQNLSATARFSQQDFIRIGNLVNAQYFLFGSIQRLPGNRFSLQLSITESSTGVRRANFMKDGTLAQLEGRATLLNEATAELLSQLGVQLTESGIQTLLAGNISTVQAQTGLARGIAAQAGGSEVEALFNFAQAITFDPSQLEALSRLNTISTTISDGTISQRILNDIQARDLWVEAFKETARFFNSHPPFEIIFDPNLIQIGETDFRRRTATLGMRIALYPSDAGFAALNALLEGLERTNRREAWGFSGWPFMDITPRIRDAVVFGGRRSHSFKVDVALINENNRKIGNSSITLNTELIGFLSGDRTITPPASVDYILNFSNVNADELTPTMTIVIVAVNGIPSHELSTSGYMRIETGDLETKARERETAEKIKEQQEQLAQEQRERQLRQMEITRELAERREREQQERERQQRLEQRYRRNNFDITFLSLSCYFQSPNETLDESPSNDSGLPVNFSIEGVYNKNISLYTSFGIGMRIGINDIYGDSVFNESEDSLLLLSNIGLVFPIGFHSIFFTNISLEIGSFPPGMRGIISNLATPSLNFGTFLQFNYIIGIVLEYRLSWHEYTISEWLQRNSGFYFLETSNKTILTHGIVVGLGIRI